MNLSYDELKNILEIDEMILEIDITNERCKFVRHGDLKLLSYFDSLNSKVFQPTFQMHANRQIALWNQHREKNEQFSPVMYKLKEFDIETTRKKMETTERLRKTANKIFKNRQLKQIEGHNKIERFSKKRNFEEDDNDIILLDITNNIQSKKQKINE
jgi:hypothetical protein